MFVLRLRYAAAALCVVALGLLWRSPLLSLSPFLRKYGGDALWALMVYLGFRFLLAHRSTFWSVGLALLFATAIEFSQLYHPPWLDALRELRLGRLILGSTFNWPDLPAYAFGILAGAAIDAAARRMRAPSPSK
ncbi:MAG: DUF2809 domain-containing protein [Chthoniobacteraceae bacterium]